MSDGGRIVLISSTAGQRGEAGHGDYAASKGALISFVKGVAVELANQGITVNCVAPGWIDTEMAAQPYAGRGTHVASRRPSRSAASRRPTMSPVRSCSCARPRASHHGRGAQRERRLRPVRLMRAAQHQMTPRAVLEIAQKLNGAGHDVWAVGGAVRDALHRPAGGDWDLATSARPEDVRRIFRRTVPIGIEHGTVGVLADDGVMYEVTTFRRDVETTAVTPSWSLRRPSTRTWRAATSRSTPSRGTRSTTRCATRSAGWRT
jgi:hypothetical protein